MNALMQTIAAHGGRIHLGEPASRIIVEDGRVTGVQTSSRRLMADAVISTAPISYVSALVPELPQE